MADPLGKYRNKRNPAETNEPFGAEHRPRSPGTTWEGRFVIHQHAATRMHFDLRLEVAGRLQSFAIPKGIQLRPDVKHLAVHTEDHPLEYLHFEDVIPKGNYGAGSMIVWDTGRFSFVEADGIASLERGKLDFVLQGFKAKGRFALIATGRRKTAQGLARSQDKAAEWLLIKKKDEHAHDTRNLMSESPRSVLSGLSIEELADKNRIVKHLGERAQRLHELFPPQQGQQLRPPLSPMVVQSGEAPLSSPRHLYELKMDGVRILASKERASSVLHYRSGRACTRNYDDIARAISKLPVQRAVFDGEIVTFDENGRPNFGLLAPRIQATRAADLEAAQSRVPVVYFVFDLLSLEEHDLSAVPLEERKQLLKEVVRGSGFVTVLDHIVERGDALWELCRQQQLEGMVVKRRDAPYFFGPHARGDWIKMKRKVDDDFVIVGFSLSARNEFKALLVAQYLGDKLIYLGRVGTGFSNNQRVYLYKALEQLKRATPALELPSELKAVFVEPELVAKVRYQGLSNRGHLRAASFQGLHESKSPQACKATHVGSGPDQEEDSRLETILSSQQVESDGFAEDPLRSARVRLTNLEKTFFPDEGYTKGDVLRYYAEVAPAMLRYLEGRPVVLVRYPDGITGKSFYQWRAPDKAPDWVRTVELYDEEKQKAKGRRKSAFLIDHVDTLLFIANLGCIPLHILSYRQDTPDCCDFITVDFDLGERPFSDGVRLALSLKEILDDLGLLGFPKTSGQRGIHVLIPVGAGITFESAKILCELLGRLLLGRHSDIASMQRRIEKRENKVYIDTGQTGRSRTIVAPYSVRAYPGARVSTPLHWHEMHLALDPGAFTINSVPERLVSTLDPMLALFDARPDIPRVLAQLARWTAGS